MVLFGFLNFNRTPFFPILYGTKIKAALQCFSNAVVKHTHKKKCLVVVYFLLYVMFLRAFEG